LTTEPDVSEQTAPLMPPPKKGAAPARRRA
jgi:hypothetical protein